MVTASVAIASAETKVKKTSGLPVPEGGQTDWQDPFTFHNDSAKREPPTYYKEGPLPTISDSLFSLIILLYVGVIFIFMFFAFCWKEPHPPPPDPAHKNIPMITSMLEEMEKQEREAAALKAAEEEAKKLEDLENGTEMKELKLSSTDRDDDAVIVNVITEERSATAVGGSASNLNNDDEEAATQV